MPGVKYTINFSLNDVSPPVINNFSIEGGSQYTDKKEVNLAINAKDDESGLYRMSFSNDNSAWSPAEPFSASKIWRLSNGEGLKTIYARVEDRAGNKAHASASIIFNEKPPLPVPTPQSGFIDGEVYDAKTLLPLQAAEVTVSGLNGTIFTDAQGKFSFPTSGSGEFAVTFKKEGYVFAQRKISVVSTRDASVEPILLTPVDPKVTEITGAGGTHIDSTGKVEITIPPNALPQGTEKIEVQATLYEDSRELPGPLPQTSFYTYALDIKPDGINFIQPVAGKVANDLNFAPGTQIPIGYYNSRILKWEDTGSKGVVSSDGRWVEFQITHFSPYDINFPILGPHLVSISSFKPISAFFQKTEQPNGLQAPHRKIPRHCGHRFHRTKNNRYIYWAPQKRLRKNLKTVSTCTRKKSRVENAGQKYLF